jgi:hypothetical protein
MVKIPSLLFFATELTKEKLVLRRNSARTLQNQEDSIRTAISAMQLTLPSGNVRKQFRTHQPAASCHELPHKRTHMFY